MRTETNLVETGYHPLGPFQIVARIVDFLFGLLTLVLLVRFVLELINAAPSSGFFEFIRRISDPFLSPFRGIVGSTTLEGGYHVVWSFLVAILAYALLHAVIRGFLRLLARA